MTVLPLYVRSHHGMLGGLMNEMITAGRVRAVWEWDVTPGILAASSGVILTMHLDQILAETWRDDLDALLARGGRIWINGHVMRRYVTGLDIYRLAGRKRDDLVQTVLADHEVFDGVDRASFQQRRGVAGFYGRGHNPMPEGATALTGVGADRAPLDWVWHRPDGGAVFSHAGNDLWGTAETPQDTQRLLRNVVAWVSGQGVH